MQAQFLCHTSYMSCPSYLPNFHYQKLIVCLFILLIYCYTTSLSNYFLLVTNVATPQFVFHTTFSLRRPAVLICILIFNDPTFTAALAALIKIFWFCFTDDHSRGMQKLIFYFILFYSLCFFPYFLLFRSWACEDFTELYYDMLKEYLFFNVISIFVDSLFHL